MAETEAKQNAPSPPDKPGELPKKLPYRVYRKQILNIMILAGVLALILGLGNILINRKANQERIADFLYEKTQIRATFDDLKIHLFVGTISGDNIALDFKKNQFFLSLKRFKIHFNPIYFLVGKIKINAVVASQIYLDTSLLTPSEKKERPKHIPNFLKNLKLTRAEIDQFYWNQGATGYLFVDKVRLASRFGSVFYKSPMTMQVEDLKYIGPKLHVFADEIKQDGFFIFDLSQPRIFDESRLTSKVEINSVLLALKKRRKPWLTTPGWDEDLNPVISRYYTHGIPDDQSYLYVKKLGVDFEKKRNHFTLNSFTTHLHDAVLKGKGEFNRKNGDFTLSLKTQNPISFSKLPLGQSQVRQAFDQFTLELAANGKAFNLNKNNLKINVSAKLIGNKNNPTLGDVDLSLDGKIFDSVLSADLLKIKLADGTITGKGTLELKTGISNTNFTCTHFDALTVMRVFSTVNIPAITDCKGSITEKLSNPRLQIAMTSQDAGYEFLHFGPAQGNLLLENKNLKLDVASTTGDFGQSHLELKIQEVFDSFKQIMDLKSAHSDVDVQKLLNSKSLKGRISGTFELKRRETVNSAHGEFSVKNFTFFDRDVGTVSTKLKLLNRHLSLNPITVELDEPKMQIASTKGLDFDFDEGGYRFSGQVLPEINLKGDFRKADREHIKLDLVAKEVPLKIFTNFLPFEPGKSVLSGDFGIKYHIYEPILSQMQGTLSKLLLTVPEGLIELTRSTSVGYSSKAFQFKSFELKAGNGRVILNGALGLAQNSTLKVTGGMDFNVISDFNPFISESDNPIEIDLIFREDIYKPKIFGKVVFKNDTMLFRNLLGDFEDITGTLNFEGNRIAFQNIHFFYDDAPMFAEGYVTTDYELLTGADLKLTGTEVPVHLTNGLNILTDLDLNLKGTGQLTLAGKVKIVEGQYNRDFGLTNFILKPREVELDEESETGQQKFGLVPDTTKLALDVKNTGDFLIKNNLAELEMQADLEMIGTIITPELLGQIDFVSGEINAFGIDFEDATGYAQFKPGDALNPDVQLVAKKEIQEYEIHARVQGRSDNLRLRLDSTPSLDRREILAILFYGQTPDRLIGERRHQFTQTAAISQLASVLSKPINKISGLDVVEVSSRQVGSNTTVQRLSVGKSLSNRFNLLFTTDLGIEDPERAFELEYQLFDNFYFIAAKDIGDRDRYRFDISYRLQAY